MTTIAELKQHAVTAHNDDLSQLLARPHRFDPDAFYVMDQRDNQLVRDQVLHGYVSGEYVYAFMVKGKLVSGISVVGARELASQYKGVKSTIVATIEKRGALFIFRTFSPLSIETRELPSLAADDDWYECVMEVTDIKTGNSGQFRKRESRLEKKSEKSGGGTYERPHYDVIAESKARRNGILDVLPQSVSLAFEIKCLTAGLNEGAYDDDVARAVKAYLAKKQSVVSVEKTMDQLCEGVLQFAAKSSIPLDRAILNGMTYAQINGLGVAAKEGVQSFTEAAISLGLLYSPEKPKTGGDNSDAPPPPPTDNAPRRPDAHAVTPKRTAAGLSLE